MSDCSDKGCPYYDEGSSINCSLGEYEPTPPDGYCYPIGSEDEDGNIRIATPKLVWKIEKENIISASSRRDE